MEEKLGRFDLDYIVNNLLLTRIGVKMAFLHRCQGLIMQHLLIIL